LNGTRRLRVRDLKKGDCVRVDWFDASEHSGPLEEHEKPEILVSEFGIFLGVEGKPQHILVGKFYVKHDQSWQATRIPLSLVQKVEVIARSAVSLASLRRYIIKEYKGREGREVRHKCVI
jgi:hypothetical protein